MDATGHARPCGNAKRAQAAPTRRDRTQYLYLSYIVYNIYRSPDYRETSLLTLITASHYTPENFI